MFLKFNGSRNGRIGRRISNTRVACLAGNLIGLFLPPTGKLCSLWTLLWPGLFVLHCVRTACSLTHLPASSSDRVYVTLLFIVQHSKWSYNRPPVFNQPPPRDKHWLNNSFFPPLLDLCFSLWCFMTFCLFSVWPCVFFSDNWMKTKKIPVISASWGVTLTIHHLCCPIDRHPPVLSFLWQSCRSSAISLKVAHP